MDWKGLVLVNKHFGYCKVTDQAGTRVKVHFIGANREAEYGVQAIERDFDWRPLPVGMKCNTADRGVCTITEAPFGPTDSHGAHEYVVIFEGEGAETARLSERELWPIPGSLSETPLGKIASLQARLRGEISGARRLPSCAAANRSRILPESARWPLAEWLCYHTRLLSLALLSTTLSGGTCWPMRSGLERPSRPEPLRISC